MKKTKKMIGRLALFMLTCSFMVLALSAEKVQAGCGTREKALEWVYAQEGKSLDYDGYYGAQCVDLINFYYRFLGVAIPGGNSHAFAYNELPAGWARIQNTPAFVMEPGDIAVWESSAGSGLGHVAIVLSADVHSFVSMDQNWGSRPCRKVMHDYNGFWGVIRPDFDADSSKPVIENVKVTNVSAKGYTVSCTVTDDVGVDRVQFPTWTQKNGQDDIQEDWQISDAARGMKSGNTYMFHVSASDHGHESGIYYTHIYAYDTGGNWASYELSAMVDATRPIIKNVKLTDVSAKGYTVSCTVTDDTGVDRVQFPTWTQKNGQDDIQEDWQTSSMASGMRSGNTYTYRVSISDHNNETGVYHTHIYAYDACGNWASYGVKVTLVDRLLWRSEYEWQNWCDGSECRESSVGKSSVDTTYLQGFDFRLSENTIIPTDNFNGAFAEWHNRKDEQDAKEYIFKIGYFDSVNLPSLK